jgi:hypothetical protein
MQICYEHEARDTTQQAELRMTDIPKLHLHASENAKGKKRKEKKRRRDFRIVEILKNVRMMNSMAFVPKREVPSWLAATHGPCNVWIWRHEGGARQLPAKHLHNTPVIRSTIRFLQSLPYRKARLAYVLFLLLLRNRDRRVTISSVNMPAPAGTKRVRVRHPPRASPFPWLS